VWKYKELKKVRETVGLLCRITRGGARLKAGWEYKGFIRSRRLLSECERASNIIAMAEEMDAKRKFVKEDFELYFKRVVGCLPTDTLELVMELRDWKFKDETKKLPYDTQFGNAKTEEYYGAVGNEIAERILLKG